MNASDIISVGALAVSAISAAFSIVTWREAHRPRVIARVHTVAAGNRATALELVVENVGNHPASAVTLACEPGDLKLALHPDASGPIREAVRRCFQDNRVIHVLEPRRPVTCAFGTISPSTDSTWIPDRRLPVRIHYRDLKGRRGFEEHIVLQLSDDTSFTGNSWHLPKPQAG